MEPASKYSPILRFPSQPNKGDISASEVVCAYLTYKRSEIRVGTFSEGAYKSRVYYLHSFLDFIGGSTPSNRLVNGDMRRWLVANPQWRASNTKADACGALCACWNWACNVAELVDRCPFRRTGQLYPPPEPLSPVEPDELAKVLKTAQLSRRGNGRARPSRKAFRAGLFFISETGMRTFEMRIVRIEWIDWTKRIITIPPEHNKIRRKSGQPRLIPLSRKAIRFLWWHCRGRHEGLIFRNGRGKPWTCRAFASQWRIYARKCGVREDARAYACRHGWTVQALENGLDAKECGDILGHTSGKQVERVYGRSTRFRAARLTDSVDKLDAAKKRRTQTNEGS